MDVFMLKEENRLDDGETKFYVTPYETEAKALAGMKKDINEHIENNDASITDGEIGDWEVELADENKNEYVFQIEVSAIK